MDEATRTYFETIERHFIERRGQALLLSPADVARVAGWRAQGVPLEAVIEGVDVHFERMLRRGRAPRRAVTLAYVEDDVMDAWAGVRRRRVGRAVGGDGAGQAPAALATRAELARLGAALDAARARLEGAGDQALADLVAAARAKLDTKAALFDETTDAHDDERAEDHLRRLEKGLLARARASLGPEAESQLVAQAQRDLAARAARLEDSARERAIVQLVDRSLRERLGIPRLSLFYA